MFGHPLVRHCVAVALVVAATSCFWPAGAGAQAKPLTVSQLYVDVDGDAVRENDAGVGRTGDVLEVDAPGGVKLQDGGTDVLTATSSGVTLNSVDLTGMSNVTGSGDIVLATSPTITGVTLTTPDIGAATGTSLDLSSWLDAAGGIRVNVTEIIDASGNVDPNNDTGTGSLVRATNPALDGTAQASFKIDSDNTAGAEATTSLVFERGSGGADAALRWYHTDGEFELIDTSLTLLDLEIADLTAVNVGLTGTLTGMTNVTGSGSIVLATSPTLTTPNIGAATGTSVDLSGNVDGGAFLVNGVEVIADDKTATFAEVTSTGDVNGVAGVFSGAVSGTTGTFTGNVGLSGNSRRLNLTGWTGVSGQEGRVVFDSSVDGDTWIGEAATDDVQIAVNGTQMVRVNAGGLTLIGSGGQIVWRSTTSAATPGIAAGGDGNTGFYSSGADAVDVTTGGTRAGGWNSSNQFDVTGDRITVGGAQIIVGTGTPESAVTGNVGDLFLRTDGGASTTLYVKESGTGNTGWAAK